MITTLPTIPKQEVIEYRQTIPYAALSSPQHTFSTVIVGLPANYVVCGTCIQVLTQFSGSSLSSLTCSLAGFVPDSILADILYYGPELELTQTVTPQSVALSGPPNNNLALVSSTTYSPSTALFFNGAHDVATYFTAQGTTLDNLTAGVVEVTVQVRPF